MKRRSLLIAAAAVVAVPAVPEAWADAIELNFLHCQQPGTYDAVIAAFEKANPGITVRQQIVPFDALNAQVEARVGMHDSSIDIYGADEPRVPALATRRLLQELPALMQPTIAATTGKAVNAVEWNSKLYALPEWTSTQLLFYNRDLLEKAGVAAPVADANERMTWADLLVMAGKAQKAGARWGFGFEQVDRYYQLQPLFESAGAGPGLTGPGLLTPDVTNPKWVSTMGWYGDLYKNGLAPRGITPEQMPSLFINGQLAFFVAGPWNFAPFEAAKDLHFGIAPHPYFVGGKAVTPTDSWAVGISPYGRHSDAATKFAACITLNDEGALLSTVANPLPPANKAAFERNVAQQSKAGGAATAPYADILNHELAHTAVSRPRTIGYVIFEEIMTRAFSDVRDGANPKRRLDQAQAELTGQFRRLR